MIAEFIREQKRYTQIELSSLFGRSVEKAVPIIRKLKEYNVLKTVRASAAQKDLSDLSEEDIEVADVVGGETEYYYVFTFVGVIVVSDIVIKCYPKYLLHQESPREELKQVIKVIEKYNSKEQIVRMFNDRSENKSFNLLAVFLFLLHDYYENGLYSNTEDIIECNGTGEILWGKTINETFALISGNRPYYTELQTKKRISDDYDYFKRLHETVLTIASKELENSDLLDLFELSPIDLSDQVVSDFGESEYILYRIDTELATQFNTRKQLVLKTLYAYINNNGSLYDTDALSLYGTNCFNLVWEDVCAEIMDNKLNSRLDTLKLPVPLKDTYSAKCKLIDLIEKPFWSITEHSANDTLTPDLVSISVNEADSVFVIFDAKYYNAILEKGVAPKGQPGIESITKQYLYQLAYTDFITDHHFGKVENCFLLPTDQERVIDKGEVSMEMLHKYPLENIKIRLLPAQIAYSLYLSGGKYDITELKL